MSFMATSLLFAVLATAAILHTNASPILSVTFETHIVGNETKNGLAVRRWHLDKDELGEPIAFLEGKWHANGGNKCAYDSKNKILYIFTHDSYTYGPATAEITGVTVNHPVNTVVKRLPPAPGCSKHNSINFDSSSGEIIHTCIAGPNYSINRVDTVTGAASTLRTVAMDDTTLYLNTLPGYDIYNQVIAMTYFDGEDKIAFVPTANSDPYTTGENEAYLLGPIWSGKKDGSMISFGYSDNLTTASAVMDSSTNTVTTNTLATVQGDISGIWNGVQAYDPNEDILYAFAGTDDDPFGYYLVGVYGSTGKVVVEFKTKSQSNTAVCLIVE